MRIYFERYVYCTKCNESFRQTATELPLDKVGEALSLMRRWEFKQEHKECNARIKYSGWKLGKICLE